MLLRHERVFIVAVCIAAAVRVFTFSSAFPFFNNVDEQAHLDLVGKYSRFGVPGAGDDLLDPEFLKWMVLLGSPEYLRKAEKFPTGVFPTPGWARPDAVNKQIHKNLQRLKIVNHEQFNEPLYYIVAGAWQRLGRALGLTHAGLLYWTRFLNIPLYVVIVLLGWQIGKTCFPQEPHQRLGLPLLISALPQDVFYSVSNDVLSPLFAGVAFYALARLFATGRKEMCLAAAGGATAAAILVKVTNIPLLGMLTIAIFFYYRDMEHGTVSRDFLRALALSSAVLIVPLAAWFGHSYATLGHLTGSAHKMKCLGITYQPLWELFDHPIYGLAGFSHFLHHFMAAFWRGEFVWQLERLAFLPLDYFYSVSSGVFLVISVAYFWSSRRDSAQHAVFVVSSVTVGLTILLWAGLSVIFDYGSCQSPSRQNPYFLSGRYMLCALYPFFIVYIDGAKILLRKVSPNLDPLAVLLVIALTISGFEIWINWPAFSSLYNFFHMPLGAPESGASITVSQP